MPDPVCHSKACAAHACPRSVHRYGYERGSYRYLKCSTHRGCAEFEDVEPLHGWLMEANDSLVDALGSVIDTEAGLRQAKAVGIQTAPVEEQPVLIEEVSSDGRRLSDEPERASETSAPATGTRLPDELLIALRQERLDRGWSQRDLAERAGLRQSAISKIESGYADPMLPTVRMVAGALGFDLVLQRKAVR